MLVDGYCELVGLNAGEAHSAKNVVPVAARRRQTPAPGALITCAGASLGATEVTTAELMNRVHFDVSSVQFSRSAVLATRSVLSALLVCLALQKYIAKCNIPLQHGAHSR